MTARPEAPILVGIDGSTAALRAAVWAAARAHRGDRRVALLGVEQSVGGTAAGWLRRAREHVLAEVPDAAVDTATACGDLADVVVARSRAASMVVLATHPVHEHGALLSGAQSVRIAGKARCPVVIARGHSAHEPPPVTGPIALGLDGGPTCAGAITFAFQEATECGTDLVAVHAWQPQWTTQQAAAHVAEDQLATWREKFPDVPVQLHVVREQPIRALRYLSGNARMLVVGNRGPDAYQSLVLGSTAQHLIHHAAGPVAVVRADVSI